MFAVFLVKLDTSLHNTKHFILAVKTVKLSGQPRVPSQLSAQLNPEPLCFDLYGSGGADVDTPAARQARVKVDFRRPGAVV